ncbi:hypothetical protein BJ508DRAFT_115810 [Ascobolus immersus RN42]|uniref:Uncharacterized protein n=1 Tax=Ascobolus immersus RN42 TaxID=1160509 RepID=A0A3N4I9B6_ASCIM|nr:hypothetical protein BJ508DRAFT_115810 [Ascobolus immersus RN42]
MSENPITTSSDAGATLIVNIAPLLVLVGEKHVKGYFKIMSKPSHAILFAAGPIGLVTAVTTLIRLKGSTTLRRLIGRLFETRAEIFADVTGVSSGDVVLELKNGTLEQSLEPNDEDVALFFFHGGMDGSLPKALEYWQRCYQLFMSLCYATVAGAEVQSKTVRHSVLGGCVRALGPDAAEKLVKAAKEATSCTGILEALAEEDNVDAAVLSFGSFTDMSLSLTLNENLDGKGADAARIGVAVFCLFANAGLIAANWFVQKDIQGTIMITIGTAISAGGSYHIAKVVNDMSIRRKYSLEGLNLSRSGFFSKRISVGISLTFTPNVVVTSEPGPWGHALRNEFNWIAHAVIGLMSAGYVVLYLGLRTAEWWVCFCILGISVLASVSRAIIVPDILNSTGDYSGSAFTQPNPFSRNMMRPPKDYLTFEGSGSRRMPATSSTSNSKSSVRQSTGNFREQEITTGESGEKQAEPAPQKASTSSKPHLPTTSLYHELIFNWYTTGSNNPGSLLDEHSLFVVDAESSRHLCGAVFQALLILRERKLVPIELVGEQAQVRGMSGGANYLLSSEWIRTDGVLRQPLQILVSGEFDLSDPFHGYAFSIPLNTWYWRCKSREQTEGILDWENDDLWITRKSICPKFSSNTISDHEWMKVSTNTLWMAIKISSLLYRNWSLEKIRLKYFDEIDRFVQDSRFGKLGRKELDEIIEGCFEAGLLTTVEEEVE